MTAQDCWNRSELKGDDIPGQHVIGRRQDGITKRMGQASDFRSLVSASQRVPSLLSKQVYLNCDTDPSA